MSLKLAEESRNKEIDGNIKRLSLRKLEFKANKVYRRQNSWKGIEEGLFSGFETEEYQKHLEGVGRPKSRIADRSKLNRAVVK